MSSSPAFVINAAYDYDQASDGQSRFGAYLRQYAHFFRHSDGGLITDPAWFAAIAWTIASKPTMSPGYVCFPPLVTAVRIVSGDHTTLLACLDAHIPLPENLVGLIHVAQMQAHISVDVLLPADELPVPVYDRAGTPDLDCARTAVHLLTLRLSEEVHPILVALDEEHRREQATWGSL